MKYIALLLILSLLVSGCSFLSDLISGPEEEKSASPSCNCPDPSLWSECSVIGIKTRTDYKCSPETNYECEEFQEQKECEKEIIIQGEKGLKARIYPTIDEEVRGVIRVEVFEVPEGTESITFLLHPQGVQLGPNMSSEDLKKLTRMYDTNGKDGWMILIDTKTFDDALYTINVLPTYKGAPEENPWLDMAQAQIVVKN